MFSRENPANILIGDNVKIRDKKVDKYAGDNDRPYKVINMVKKDDNIFVSLYDGIKIINGVEYNDVNLSKKNITSSFRINCESNNFTNEFVTNDYIYLLVTQDKNYRLVRNSGLPNYIYKSEQIPLYVSYFLYNNCIQLFTKNDTTLADDTKLPNIVREKTNVYGLNGFLLIFESFYEKYNTQITLGVKEKKEVIKKELRQIDKEKHNMALYLAVLNKKIDKPPEEKAKETSLKADIKDLDERIIELEQDLFYLGDDSLSLSGGEVPTKPSEEYVSNTNYPQNQYNQYITGDPRYLPGRTTYERNVPYNVSQNKAKDQKSKMSFYITIELELFPGESANPFQKSIVKCQSTFERIREAYADLFGYQYRPAPMSEAYAYGASLKKEEKREGGTRRKKCKQTNKTRKYAFKKADAYFVREGLPISFI